MFSSYSINVVPKSKARNPIEIVTLKFLISSVIGDLTRICSVIRHPWKGDIRGDIISESSTTIIEK